MDFRILFVFPCLLLLTACGGGSSGGGSNQAPLTTTSQSSSSASSVSPKQSGPFTITLENTSISLEENGLFVVNVVTTNADGVLFNVSGSDGSVSGVYGQGKLTITATNIDRNKAVTLKLSGSRGVDISESSLTISVNNTSANKLVSDTKIILAQAEELSDFSQENTIFNFLNDLSFKSGKSSRANMMMQAADFRSLMSLTKSAVNKNIAELKSTLTDYQNSIKSDEELREAYDAVLAALNQQGKLAIEKINALSDSSKLTPAIAFSGFIYSSKTNEFSQFVGNLYLGGYSSDVWSFNRSFEYLGPLLNSNTCIVK